MSFGTSDDLVARLSSTLNGDSPRRLALLLGSGVAQPSVPGANQIVKLLRNGLTKEEQQDLDKRLAPLGTNAEKYQAAFQFLSFRRPPEFRERTVTIATLRAYSRVTPDTIDLARAADYEADVDGWKIPDGLAAVGRLWAGLPQNLRGPILTTNFDPLVEVSVRRAGGNATTYVHSDDSSFLTNLKVQSGTPVVHLHGFWRDSSTLHTRDQLDVDRPAISATLRAILQDHTLAVVGYGGWSDVITRQLGALVGEQNTSGLDILWAVFEGEAEAKALVETTPALAHLRSAPGNVIFYSGVDANVAFPSLEKRVEGLLEYSGAARAASRVPVGWTEVTADFISQHVHLASNESALSFFDGRLPQWRDASGEQIPVLDAARNLANAMKSSIAEGEPSMTQVIGPSGEGKTTALMQAAAEIARSGEATVLYLGSAHIGDIEQLLQLPSHEPHVLCIDDAHRVGEQLKNLAASLAESSKRNNLHIAVAARDSDWQSAGCATFHWSRLLKTRRIPVAGVNRPDAVAIVSAWESIGPAALGALGKVQSREDRVQRLMLAATESPQRTDGSLLGALLITRYGEGLRDHVRELMTRTKQWNVPGSALTLLDALVTVALPHANGITQLGFPVLASALQVTEPTLFAFVLAPLGEEAAISYGSGHVLIRHSAIAATICDLAGELGVDLEVIARSLAAAAARRLELLGGFEADAAQLAFMQLRTHPEYQVSAAKAAVEAAPERIAFRTHLSASFRRAHQPQEAVRTCASSAPLIQTAVDPTSVRSFLTEWGVAEGSTGQWARNSVLVGIALQDSASLPRLNLDKAQYPIHCLPLALYKLFERTRDVALLRGAAACLTIGEYIDPRGSRPWLGDLERLLDREHVSIPAISDVQLLRQSLTESLRVAISLIEAPLPGDTPAPSFRFAGLLSLNP